MESGKATLIGLRFRLDFESTRPIYLQIIDEVKRAVARGDLEPGDRLPSQRELAELARVNPNTVQRAFREMEVTGLVETLRGQGTFLRNDPGLLGQIRLEMAEVAVRQFVHEMRRLGLGVVEAVGLVERMWNAPGQDPGQDADQPRDQEPDQTRAGGAGDAARRQTGGS